MALIKLQEVKRNYGNQWAVNGVSLELNEGEQVCIKGASGSGKSTLLYMLGGLERPSHGTIKVKNLNLTRASDQDLAHYRNEQVGFVFQFHFLLSTLSALDNVRMPIRIAGKREKDYQQKIEQLADRLGVKDCLKKFPYQLSGGEQQRISIMRALVLAPPILLCDEPTGNLDSQNSANVIDLLKELARPSKTTLVVVTHDDAVATKFSRQLYMKDGKLI
ncbi:MAG: ABC transporter ATP-binding protein [Bdellovibrio sp.]